MSFPDLDDARRQHAALLEIIIHNTGGWADRASLHRIVALCQAAKAAIDDVECAESVRLIAECAADLLSDEAHRKWDRGSISGVDYLRLEIIRALHSFNRRLGEIEATRRGSERPQPSVKGPAA